MAEAAAFSSGVGTVRFFRTWCWRGRGNGGHATETGMVVLVVVGELLLS
jgi:hypothetical protein